MEKICKNYEKCPIYHGVLKDRTTTAKVFKIQFCEAGEFGWNKCKRYLIKEQTGKCPPDLLPNCDKSVEQIIREMNMN